MKKIFKDFFQNCVVIYMDNIIVFSKTNEERGVHIQQTLDTILNYQLVAKPSNCEFLRRRIYYWVIPSPAPGSKNLANVEAITNFPPSRNSGKVRTFLGMIAFLKKSLQDVANL